MYEHKKWVWIKNHKSNENGAILPYFGMLKACIVLNFVP
jgi:hypothetical protein